MTLSKPLPSTRFHWQGHTALRMAGRICHHAIRLLPYVLLTKPVERRETAGGWKSPTREWKRQRQSSGLRLSALPAKRNGRKYCEGPLIARDKRLGGIRKHHHWLADQILWCTDRD